MPSCRDLVHILFGIEYFLYLLKYKSSVIGHYCVSFAYVYTHLMERHLSVGYDNYQETDNLWYEH